MKLSLKLTILSLALGLMTLASCSADSPEAPFTTCPDEETTFTLSFAVDGFDSSTGSRATGSYCWTDWNENLIRSIDIFFFVPNEDNQSSYLAHRITKKVDTGYLSNDCDNHPIVRITTSMSDPLFSVLAKTSFIYVVANYDLPEQITNNREIQFSPISLWNNAEIQDAFVMEARVVEPKYLTNLDEKVIKLRRCAAKIRLTLYGVDDTGTKLSTPLAPDTWKSNLRNHTYRSGLQEQGAYDAWRNEDLIDVMTANEYPFEMEDGSSIYRDNGHVYYSLANDWFDFDRLIIGCTITNSDHLKKHTAANGGENRYMIKNYDDSAPILPERETFLLVQAPYHGKQYFYKVPVNYRFYAKNDQQCFGGKELENEIYPLYQIRPNTFYDISAIIDRPGAAEPATAPYLTISVAPMVDGGTFDYVYD